MAVSYSANQYENAFVSQRLLNWESPKSTGNRPGFNPKSTKAIADANGHLISGHKREGSARTSFVGTWELPKQLPGNNIDNPMARDADAYDKLRSTYGESRLRLTGQKFNYRAPQRSTQKASHKTAGVTSSEQADVLSLQQSAAQTAGPAGAAPETTAAGAQLNGEDQLSNKIPVPDFSREDEFDRKRENLAGL